MTVFVCHNKADKGVARFLAIALVEQGENVWFDEWEIRPGDSITGGLEKGLSESDVFVIVWSKNAKQSNWVGTEMSAYLRRRVDDQTLRIVPIMLDDTPLPTLVADYRGFNVDDMSSLEDIAAEITGDKPDKEIARLLQAKLLDLAQAESTGDPLPYLVCPKCASPELMRSSRWDNDHNYYVIECKDCKWYDWTEI